MASAPAGYCEQPMPAHLRGALESGRLTDEQLREVIAYEAGLLGLTFDRALALSRAGRLPSNTVGTDLKLWISLLRR